MLQFYALFSYAFDMLEHDHVISCSPGMKKPFLAELFLDSCPLYLSIYFMRSSIQWVFSCVFLLFHFKQNYANFIPGATVGVLENDSRNVLELILTAYKVQ